MYIMMHGSENVQIPLYKNVEAMKAHGVWRYSSTLRPLYIRGNIRRYPLDRSYKWVSQTVWAFWRK